MTVAFARVGELEKQVLEITDIIDKLPSKPDDANRLTRQLNTITKIVVHYDGIVAPSEYGKIAYDPLTRYRDQARGHVKKNWNESSGPRVHGFGLMHHYRVSGDGRIWRTQPEETVVWHSRGANFRGLAVCCDLGLGQSPTLVQIRGLWRLLDWLCDYRLDIPASRADVWGHSELSVSGELKACPGKLLTWVQAYRRD